VGLVGAGRISSRHIEALAELPGLAELTAVAELKAERLSAVNERGVSHYSDVSEMMEAHSDLDLVSVLTESGNHKDVALQLLRWRTPVLIEKPLTLSVVDAKELTGKFAEVGVPLFVVKQNRLNPPVAELLLDIKAGRLGKIMLASASVLWSRSADYYFADEWRLSREMDGGVVWNQASHYVDLLVQVLGGVESVFAYGDNFLSPAQTEDTVFAVMRSSSGAMGSLQATTTVRPANYEGSLTVSGDLGLVKVGGHALNEVIASTIGRADAPGLQKEKIDSNQVYGKSHARLYEDIFSDLNGGPRSSFRAIEGLTVVAVIEAIHLSIAEKREVYLSEVLGD